MPLSGTISNSAGSPGNKDLVQAYQPLLLATITFLDGTILRLSTHPLNAAEGGFPYGGHDYLCRLLEQNIDAVQAMSETGIDIPPTMSLQIADADRFIWTNYEMTLGFKGASITLDYVLWEADTANFSSDSYRKFSGICNAPNVDEGTLTVSASSKLNMQKLLFPIIAVQTRCPWIFPPDAAHHLEALNNPDSNLYPCGYSPSVSGGRGNTTTPNLADSSGVPGTLSDSSGNFVACDYTRSGCTARGMFSRDSGSHQTGHFGGVEWDPPQWWKSKSYAQGKTISGINSPNDQRYSAFVPLVYGQVIVDGVVLNVIGDGNSTRMEVLICGGNIGNAVRATMSQGGVKRVVVNGVMIPYNFQQVGGPAPADALFRWQYVNYGSRDSSANNDAGYSPTAGVPYSGLGDPYGNLAVIEIVAPIVLVGSQSIPTVQILTVGPAVRIYSTPTVYTLAPSSNPIWTLMDLLVRGNWFYKDLNIQSFIDAAAVCDVQIPYTNNAGTLGNINVDGTPHVRYSCSLQVTTRRSAADVVMGIRNCCKAMLVPNNNVDGLLQVFIKQTMAAQQPAAIVGSNNAASITSLNPNGSAGAGYSAYDFDESSILTNDGGASSLKITQRTVVDSPNSITVNFQDQDNQFVVDSMTELDPIDVTRSGQTVSGSVSIDGLNSFDQGQRIFETRFAETFRGNPRGDSGGTLVFEFQTTQRVSHLQVGNICRFSHQQLSLSFQKVRVIKIQLSRDHETATIQLQWHEDFWYRDSYGQIGSPLYSGNNKQGVVRPPFAWQPYSEVPLPSDQLVDPTSWTFGMAVAYSSAKDGSSIATLEIFGALPVNSFAALQAPLLGLQGTVASAPTTGTLPPGLVVMAVVCPYDNSTPPLFAPPELHPCTMAIPPSGLPNYTVTIPVAAWPNPTAVAGYYLFAGTNSANMTFQGNSADLTPGNPTPTSITLSKINARWFGPPDVIFDHMWLQVKKQIHGGVWGAAVTGISSTTLTIAGANWSIDQWAGRDISVTGQLGNSGSLPVWNLRVAHNTADTLSFAPGTPNLTSIVPTPHGIGHARPGRIRPTPPGFNGINVGDAVVMRTLPDTFTPLTIGDSQFVNQTYSLIPASTVGLTPNEGSYLVRIYAGTGAGQYRKAVSNTATVYTVDQAFDPPPDATSRFWVEETTWHGVDSVPQHNSDIEGFFSGTLQIANYNQQSIVVQALTMDAADNSCFEQYAPIRDFFIFGTLGTLTLGLAGYSVIPLVLTTVSSVGTYAATPDLSLGLNQEVILLEPVSPMGTVTAATNATPVVLTVAAHGYATGQTILVAGVNGNDGANGSWTATVIDPNTFSLTGSIGTGAYTTGGTVQQFFTALINSPINGAISETWTLVIAQDLTGGRAVTFDTGFVGYAGLPAMLDMTANTYCSLDFVIRPDGRSALSAITTGISLV